MKEIYGVTIERGKVVEVADGKCRVMSFCRENVVTPPLEVLNGVHIVGDVVYFFVFGDGRGMVL